MIFRLGITALLGLAIYVVSSSRYNKYPLVGSLGALASPAKTIPRPPVKSITAHGVALISDESPEADDDCRTVALITALRNLLRSMDNDTLTSSSSIGNRTWDWRDLKVSSRACVQERLVLHDEISVKLVDSTESVNTLYRVVDSRLIDAPFDAAQSFLSLREALAARGVTVAPGRRIGQSLWEETLMINLKSLR